MASDNTTPQPGTETKQKSEQEAKKAGDEAGKSIQETKQNSEQEAKKAGDEVEKSIKKILEIVETLHTLFPTPTPTPTAEKRMGRSNTVPARPTTIQPAALETQKSVPTDIKKGDKGEPETSIPKLKRNLRLLKDDVRKLQELNSEVAEEVKRQFRPLDNLLKQVESGSTNKKLTEGNKKDLDKVNKKIFNLMCQVPLLPNKRNKNKGLDSEDGDGDNHGKPIVCLPGIHANEEDLKRLAVFKDVETKFKGLDDIKKKICLLSFAMFPENQEVNRTMLMYWWIGEGILKYKAEKGSVPENVVKEILKEFMEKKLIEPVENRRKVEPSCYKMTPFVHSSVVRISMEMKLFNIYHKGEKPTMNRSELNKVCLVEGSSSQPEAKANIMKEAHLIETVFNVSERFPEFTRKWFKHMTRLNVLYLGRWERTDPDVKMDKSERTDQEIETDSRRIMKDLSSLRRLRFLSFQGISTIKILSRSVCKLNELIILDLRYCYNLEQLPDYIDKLKNLVYLDLTGCEALESVPARLARLDNLEVLKGFVLGDVDTAKTCKLNALESLDNLRKLSVTVHREDFTLDKLIDDIKHFKVLETLKVQWGSKVSVEKKQPNKDKTEELEDNKPKLPTKLRKLPTQLRKLDLRRFPDRELPEWLWPQKLNHLENLRLGSSKRLKGFGAVAEKPTECGVKVLRLTSLLKLKVEWRELNKLFPNLRLLESYECPRVTFCPCDRNGIWRSPKNYD